MKYKNTNPSVRNHNATLDVVTSTIKNYVKLRIVKAAPKLLVFALIAIFEEILLAKLKRD
ncbi:hypothetical protein KW795_02440 [Candidatus Microgenomates bacterium]|nr:hypothetical protein [Candidatus Microgenomates bacterium]